MLGGVPDQSRTRHVRVLGQIGRECPSRRVNDPGGRSTAPCLRWSPTQLRPGAYVTQQRAATGMDGEVRQRQIQPPVDAPGSLVAVGLIDRFHHLPRGQVSPSGLAQGTEATAYHLSRRDPGLLHVSKGITKGLDVTRIKLCDRARDSHAVQAEEQRFDTGPRQ